MGSSEGSSEGSSDRSEGSSDVHVKVSSQKVALAAVSLLQGAPASTSGTHTRTSSQGEEDAAGGS